MKRAIWILKGELTARAGWISESGSGVYFGHLGDLPKLKCSYHSTGRKHVTLANGERISRQADRDTPLDGVAGRKGLGGFSIDPSKLNWTAAGPFGSADLVFKIESDARQDMPYLVSAFIFPHEEATAFANEAHSGGPYKDACIALQLVEFSHLTCVILLQYMVPKADS
jgi:hypothetical protein